MRLAAIGGLGRGGLRASIDLPARACGPSASCRRSKNPHYRSPKIRGLDHATCRPSRGANHCEKEADDRLGSLAQCRCLQERQQGHYLASLGPGTRYSPHCPWGGMAYSMSSLSYRLSLRLLLLYLAYHHWLLGPLSNAHILI